MFDNSSISLCLFNPLNSGNWEVPLLRGLRVSVIVGQYCENYSIDIDIKILHCLFRTPCLCLLTIKEN